MKVSVFTPTHNSSWLPELYEAMLNQTHEDWEWVIVYNNGATVHNFKDHRVNEVVLKEPVEPFVGKLKNIACSFCTSDIFVEVDHDDIITNDALFEVSKAFEENPDVGVVYSNAVHCDGDGNPVPMFDSSYGWQYREYVHNGVVLPYPVTFKPSPESVSRIWFSPDHIRAFRRDVYEKVGGHNEKMRVLDDQDLLCRLFCITKFFHIDKPLYIYRVHGENTWLKTNQEIQENVMRIYDQYIDYMVGPDADRKGLRKIEIGSGAIGGFQDYETLDLSNADIIHDLNEPLPFSDSSIGVIRAIDVLEHVKDPLKIMKELYRVLAPGGWLILQVPSTDGRGAFQDPTHVSFWNENSFKYYTDFNKAKYIGCPVRFQACRLYTTELNHEKVCWTVAHLISLKDGYVPAGRIEI